MGGRSLIIFFFGFMAVLYCAVCRVQSKYGTYSLSSYLSGLDCSLGELPLLGLTFFVRPNTWKTKIQYVQLQTGYGTMHNSNLKCICQIINPAPHEVEGVDLILPDRQSKHVLHNFEFLDKFNLGSSKPQQGQKYSDCYCRFWCSVLPAKDDDFVVETV